jgi:hypothetical protein
VNEISGQENGSPVTDALYCNWLLIAVFWVQSEAYAQIVDCIVEVLVMNDSL